MATRLIKAEPTAFRGRCAACEDAIRFLINGAPDTIRTCGLRLRRATVGSTQIKADIVPCKRAVSLVAAVRVIGKDLRFGARAIVPAGRLLNFARSGIAKFAPSVWILDTNNNANKTDGWGKFLRAFSMPRADFFKNQQSNDCCRLLILLMFSDWCPWPITA